MVQQKRLNLWMKSKFLKFMVTQYNLLTINITDNVVKNHNTNITRSQIMLLNVYRYHTSLIRGVYF